MNPVGDGPQRPVSDLNLTTAAPQVEPRRHLRRRDTVAIIIGLVVGPAFSRRQPWSPS